MAQFSCDTCGETFDQKSRYERHKMTSHPPQAPSAADLEKALGGVDFPKRRDELVEAAEGDEIKRILEDLPDKQYRDAAEVARAFGERRSHEKKPEYQPSKKGGAQAMNAPSAARIASLFSGLDFPASSKKLKSYAQDRASDEEMRVIEKFHDHTYRDMSDVAKEVGRVT